MLNQIPRPLLVFAALLTGIFLIFLIQEPHSVCNSQLETFKLAQAGLTYPRENEGKTRPAAFDRLLETCKMGNSPGACYELFVLLKKVNRDLEASPQECLPELGSAPEIQRALVKGLQLMVQIAWGDRPPEAGGSAKTAWLEATDLALYCQLKANYMKAYGQEEWENFRLSVQQTLPGEAPILENGQCLNCQTMKKASEALSPEEIWSKSLFSVRCDLYH